MSAVVVLTPAIIAAWPVIASVATGALASLGYAAAKRRNPAAEKQCVTLDLESRPALAEAACDPATPLVFEKGDLSIEVVRAQDGRLQVRAAGGGRTEEQLRAEARGVIDRITQQYAYHRLSTELKERGFEIVQESVEEDRSIRIKVRQWKA